VTSTPLVLNNGPVELRLPDDTVVLAQGRLNIVPVNRPRAPDFALYLDARWKTDPEVTWPHRVIAWEDFGLPVDEADTFAAIRDLFERARRGELVETACYGGVGRTGTVLACLAILAGLEPSEAVGWVRTNYHAQAIETDEQQKMIERFAASL
jgi:protein-tyrosine phosphatase